MQNQEESKKGLLSSFIDGLVKLENATLIVLMVAMTVLCFLQVLFRYIFKISAPWTEELGRYAMIWLIFIGAAWATHTKNHIEIDVIELIVKNQKLLSVIELATLLIMTVFSVFFLYSAALYIPQIVASNEKTIALGMPMWIPQSCLLVGGFLILLHCVEIFFRKLAELRKGVS